MKLTKTTTPIPRSVLVEARRTIPQLVQARERCERRFQTMASENLQAVSDAVRTGTRNSYVFPCNPQVVHDAAQKAAGAEVAILAMLDAIDGMPEKLHDLLRELGVPQDA